MGCVVDQWEPFKYEARLRGADGQYRWFLARAVPIRDHRHKTIRWCGAATDTEDRKRTEELQADLAHVNRVTTLGELAASLCRTKSNSRSRVQSQAQTPAVCGLSAMYRTLIRPSRHSTESRKTEPGGQYHR